MRKALAAKNKFDVLMFLNMQSKVRHHLRCRQVVTTLEAIVLKYGQIGKNKLFFYKTMKVAKHSVFSSHGKVCFP